MKDAFAILRAHKQLQSSIHDFALCFQVREFFRLADQRFVNVDVSASHKLIIHQFYEDWCIHAEEPIAVPDEPAISPCVAGAARVVRGGNRGRSEDLAAHGQARLGYREGLVIGLVSSRSPNGSASVLPTIRKGMD
jgi:hypothetical protein